MCGIAGIIYLNNSFSNNIETLKKASKSLQHRGPDDEGFLLVDKEKLNPLFSNQTSNTSIDARYPYSPNHSISNYESNYNIALIHRRLSIIDISASGHQPMSNQEQNIWITYNGEIYNYRELREFLKHKGFKFISNSDTEVIINAYSYWGYDCVNHFDGMWAFVIYDHYKKIIFGSRDRVGVKPLYYSITKNQFTFSSEQKCLLQSSWLSFDLNYSAVYDFLKHDLLEHQKESLFKNILELKPAFNLILDLNSSRLTVEKYYSLPVNEIQVTYNEEKAKNYIETIYNLVNNSVKNRLQSEAKVGSCLSGGIDSSVIVRSVNKILEDQNLSQIGTEQEVFHCSYDDKRFNEKEYAESVANKSKIKLHITQPKVNEFLDDIEILTYHQDLPIRSTSSYSQYRVMKLAKENNIKVILDGQGGDELFAGYYRHLPYWLSDVKKIDGNRAYRNEKQFYFNDSLERNNFLKYRVKERLKNSFIADSSLIKNFADQFLNKSLLSEFKKNNTASTTYTSLNEVLASDYSNGYLKELLYREDRNGMAHSIEARVPFADNKDLVEYLFSISGNYKIRKGKSKYLLREAFKDLLPQSVYTRKDKMGFSSPNNEWMNEIKNDLKSYITNDLEDIYNLSNFNKSYNSFFDKRNQAENYKTLKWLMFPVWLNVFKNSIK
jgi:asparagine synthase (glutamine-hydrolysing)